VVVFDGEPHFEQVCSLNDPALALGIVPGMTKLEMEMFPTAVVLQRSRTEKRRRVQPCWSVPGFLTAGGRSEQ